MRRQYSLRALGVVVCLIGTLLMAVGVSIFGADQTGIENIVRIVGLGIIARTRRMMS